MSKLLYKDETYKIIGVCIDVHKKMGNGFSYDVYEEVLQKEFLKREIPFERQKELQLYYDGVSLNKNFVAHYVCFDTIIINIQATVAILENEKKQLLNVIKATNFELGFLINFGEQSLKWKRFINTF